MVYLTTISCTKIDISHTKHLWPVWQGKQEKRMADTLLQRCPALRGINIHTKKHNNFRNQPMLLLNILLVKIIVCWMRYQHDCVTKQSKITQTFKQINQQLLKSMQSQENTYNNWQTMQTLRTPWKSTAKQHNHNQTHQTSKHTNTQT